MKEKDKIVSKIRNFQDSTVITITNRERTYSFETFKFLLSYQSSGFRDVLAGDQLVEEISVDATEKTLKILEETLAEFAPAVGEEAPLLRGRQRFSKIENDGEMENLVMFQAKYDVFCLEKEICSRAEKNVNILPISLVCSSLFNSE